FSQRRSLFLAAILFAIVSLGAAASTFGQTSNRGWEWQNPLPQGNAISAIRFAGYKLHGWAVGADGVILYTANGGFRWENQQTRLVAALNGLYALDRQRAFVVGARGVVFTTINAGACWIAVSTLTKDRLYALNFVHAYTRNS